MASQVEIAAATQQPLPPPTTTAANSRLAQMQMRFQQKQIEEREQRRIELIGGTANESVTTTASKTVSNGKVRQMFDERRRGAGFDRGNPLKPIPATNPTNNNTSNITRGTSKSYTVLRTTTTTTKGSLSTRSNGSNRSQQPQSSAGTPTSRRALQHPTSQQKSQNVLTNGYQRRMSQHYDEVDHLNNETIQSAFSTLSLRDRDGGDRNNNNKINTHNHISSNNGSNVINQRAKSSHNIKLNPVVMKKSPSLTTRTTTASSTSSRQAKSNSSSAGSNSISQKPRAAQSPTKKRTDTKMNSGIKLPPRVVTPAPGMSTCQYCLRNFNDDRLAKHEQVCQKVATSKRKIYDTTKHRVQGTDAEKYLRKPHRNGNPMSRKPGYITASSAPGDVKKNNWRKKHEEFIAAIREAKKVQAHLAKGGKLSDLPPPPPSDNSDYIQCPHCMRRFNEAAAGRHIPKCANMLHNKTKPLPKKR